ncbi:MAG TPA: hypothetical protein ACQGQH_05890 [Xylella sp.]
MRPSCATEQHAEPMAAAQVAGVRQGEQLPESRRLQPRRVPDKDWSLGLQDWRSFWASNIPDKQRSEAGAVR